MKRSRLIVFVLLFAVSANGLAQQSNVAEAVYNKWRQVAAADEVSNARFAVASVTRRTSNEAVEVELWAVGGDLQSVFEIYPLYSDYFRSSPLTLATRGEPNQLRGLPRELGELKPEQNEGIGKTVVGSPSSVRGAGGSVGLKITIPITPNTSALEIKWFDEANGARQLNISGTVFLGAMDKPTESLMWGARGTSGLWAPIKLSPSGR